MDDITQKNKFFKNIKTIIEEFYEEEKENILKTIVGILLITVSLWVIVTGIILLSGVTPIISVIGISLGCLIGSLIFVYFIVFGIWILITTDGGY